MIISKEFWAGLASTFVFALVAVASPAIVGEPMKWLWLPVALGAVMSARQAWKDNQQGPETP